MHYLRKAQKQPANNSVILGIPTEEMDHKFEELKMLSLSHLLPSKGIPANVFEERMLFNLKQNKHQSGLYHKTFI